LRLKMGKKISKTKIEKRIRKKTNPLLIRILIKLKKTNPLVAKLLAMPVRKMPRVNLEKIDRAKSNQVLVIGKILSCGKLTRKFKIVGFSISKKAKEKIQKSGSEFVFIGDEMEKNPELKGLEIIK